MEAKIKTSVFAELLNKVSKGASCNKMLPLTSLVNIEVFDGNVVLTANDVNNYIRCSGKAESGELRAVVNVETLTKLVSKITTQDIELINDGKSLTVKANGTYKIELPVDESGSEIIYPDPFNGFIADKEFDIAEDVYKRIVKSNSQALSISLAEPCYTGYYFGDKVLTSDSYKICCNDYKLVDSPILLNAEVMKLVGNCSGTVKLKVAEKDVMFETEDTLIYSKLMNGIENFKAEIMYSLINAPTLNRVEFNRESFMQILDRIAIFVSPFDKNNITLHFTKDGIEISSLQTTGKEKIRYSTECNAEDFTCSVDIITLKQQVAAQSGQFVVMFYGELNNIQMKDDITTQIVALSVE